MLPLHGGCDALPHGTLACQPPHARWVAHSVVTSSELSRGLRGRWGLEVERGTRRGLTPNGPAAGLDGSTVRLVIRGTDNRV
jgi:hypothetical protein